MTDASAVEPERSIGRDAPAPLAAFVDEAAGLVFTEPRAVGERVLLTAATFVQLGDRQPRGRRALAVIAAGPDGVRVRATPQVVRIGACALAAAALVWSATRRVND